MPHIEIISPEKQTTAIELSGTEYIIGRDPQAPIQLKDKKVSRHHAKILLKNNSYWIEDLGSANGVVINGILINAPTKLQSNQDIEVGNYHLRFIPDESGQAVPFRLVGLNRVASRKIFPLPFGETTVGRVEGNSIVINDKSISRFHAKIMVTPEGIMVEDLGSSNGTFIDRQQLSSPQSAHVGQRLRFGSVEFSLQPFDGIKRASLKEIIGAIDRQYFMALCVAVMAFFMLVLVVVIALTGPSKQAQQAASVLATIEQEFSNKLEQGIRQQAKGEWDIAIATFSDILAGDPLNHEAAKRLKSCQDELSYSQALSMAQQYIKREEPEKARELLLDVPKTSHYYERVQRVLMEANSRLAEIYYRQATQLYRKNKPDYLAVHEKLIQMLSLDPTADNGRKLIVEVERNLERAQIDFVSYQQQLESIAGKSKKLVTEEVMAALKERYQDGQLVSIMALYIDGNVENAKGKLSKVTGTAGAMAASLSQRILEIQQRIEEGNGASASQQYDLAMELWDKAIQLEAGILPEAVESRQILTVKSAMAKVLYDQGENLFKRQIYSEAFDKWYKGQKLDSKNTEIMGGFGRLDSVAKNKFLEGRSLQKSNPQMACENFRMVVNITMPESQWRKQAEELVAKCH